MIDDLWYKNAVIYCLDVEKYVDANGDGVGDFAGLTRRLDYLAGLGITCLWLQPFYLPHNFEAASPRYVQIKKDNVDAFRINEPKRLLGRSCGSGVVSDNSRSFFAGFRTKRSLSTTSKLSGTEPSMATG